MSQLRPRGPSVLYALFVFTLTLVSCGGSSGSPTDPGGPTADAPGVEYISFNLVNEARGANGGRELTHDETLSRIAREYSRRMRDQGFFSHVDPSGQGFSDRLRQAGVHVSNAGENLAIVENSGTPANTAHRAFLQNPDHRANILDERFTHAGVGVARRGGTYWITQLFVRR